MMVSLLGPVLAVAIGIGGRLLDIPLPAPPKLQGALLVAAITLGFLAGDFIHDNQGHTLYLGEPL